MFSSHCISLFRRIPVVGLLLLAFTAEAQLAQNLLIGNAKAISLGNAVTADPPGVDAIHFNPAGLSRLSGRQTHLKFVAASVEVTGEFNSNASYDQWLEDNNEIDPVANTKSEVKQFAFYSPFDGVTEIPLLAAPLGGMSYSPPGSNFTFATSVYSPIAGGFIRDDDDPGRFYAREVGISRITFFSPSFAYKFSNQLSVGASIGFSYVGLGVLLDFRAPNPLVAAVKNVTDAACDAEANGLTFEVPSIDVCQGSISPFNPLLILEADVNKPISITYNLGVLWKPVEWLALGITYQSEARDKLKGDASLTLTDETLLFTEGLANSNPALDLLIERLELKEENREIKTGATLLLTMPAHLAIGSSIRISPKIKLNIDWKWTETGELDKLAVELEDSIPVLEVAGAAGFSNLGGNFLTIPRGYKNSSNFAFGIEYQYSDRTAFRVGWEPRDSGIPKNKRDFSIPIGDVDLYAFGLSHTWNKDTLMEFAFAYMKSEQYIPAGSSTNGNDFHLDNIVYNPSAGMDVRTSTEIVVFEFGYRKFY